MPTTRIPLPQSAKKPPQPAPALRLVFWESTAGCNLACVHCRRLEVSQQLSKSDLTTPQAISFIESLSRAGSPVLVFSGGEPLMRPDFFDLAETAAAAALPIALSTNGTIMSPDLAHRIADVGVRRVSISFDGPDAATHDQFRGIDGAFQSSTKGFRMLKEAGLSMQINTTVARHNYHRLDDIYAMALQLGADALHIFMLVPVGCGMSLSQEIMLQSDEYENALNWIYDRSLEGRIHLKATCAPHYFRVMRQRAKSDGQSMPASAHPHRSMGLAGHPETVDLSAMTKGCLAGQAICFVSHTGEVFPCGYFPLTSGNVTQTPLPDLWQNSPVFADLRDDSKLQGKCGCCEYKKVCMGCRARAFADTHNYLAQEPNCGFTPARMRK